MAFTYTTYDVTLFKTYPMWDEKQGIPMGTFTASSPAKARERAKERARDYGHIGGAAGGGRFVVAKVDNPFYGE